MIEGLLLVAALVAVDPIHARERSLEAQLQACNARTEREAVACMGKVLPREVRKDILDQDQPRFAAYDWDLLGALTRAFNVENEEVAADVSRQGYPVNGQMIAEVLLESFWLTSKRCRYDLRQRVDIKNREHQAAVDCAAFVAEVEADGMQGSCLPAPPSKLEVRCLKWTDAAQ